LYDGFVSADSSNAPASQSGDARTLPPASTAGSADAPTICPPSVDLEQHETATLLTSSSVDTHPDPAGPPRVDLQAGELGPYRELQALRPWKYGMVYTAVHATLRRRVWLRVLTPEHVVAGRTEEFLQAARLVAGLDHPAVESGVFEAAALGNVAFVAQEQTVRRPIEGFRARDSQQRLQEGLFPNRRLAQAFFDAASALEVIHAAGLTHGHIGTDSLYHSKEGRVRLAGVGEEPATQNAVEMSAPEAIARAPVQKDLFDLGVAVVEWTIGNTLPPDLFGRPRACVRWLRRQNPGLSRTLARIVARCLNADMRGRFSDAGKLVRALEPLTNREMVYATWGDRIATLVYDVLFSGMPVLLLIIVLANEWPLHTSNDYGAYYDLVGLAFFTGWETLAGWTLGRRIRGLRLVDVSGDRPRRTALFVRSLMRVGWLIGCAITVDLVLRYFFLGVQQTDLERTENIRALGAFVVSPILAALTLYLTSFLTPNRRPIHDYVTGVSWANLRRPDAEGPAKAVTLVEAKLAHSETVAESASAGRMDHYELRGLLGRGGMGAVYEAYDTALHRPVALKVLNASLSSGSLTLGRFEREARLAAQVSHPNVARVYGLGLYEGKPYMVMELIRGETLQQLVDREGPLPLARAWEYIRQAALALQDASRHGIVHRDIKPSNLMLAGGVVKVTDFGLSRVLHDAEGEHHAEATALPVTETGGSLTKTGMLMGTPMYMSPEQARGEKLDSRSDIYSLGLTLYFLLNGKPPFASDDMYDLIIRQCEEEPASLGARVAEFTAERDAVLQTMIAKDRARRFADYDLLLAELDATAPRPPSLASPSRRASAALLDVVLFYLAIPFMTGFVISFARRLLNMEGAQAGLAGLVGSGVSGLAYIVSVGCFGMTPSKWLLGVKVIRRDGRPLGLVRAFLRFSALYPSLLFAFVAYLLSLYDVNSGLIGLAVVFGFGQIILPLVSAIMIGSSPRRKGIHDWLAESIVIRVAGRRPSLRRPAPP
jgi:serine/threonine protein kinase